MPAIFDISLTESQVAMYMAKEMFPAYIAGFGCLRGSTKIRTIDGLVAIEDIKSPTLVQSFDQKNNQFVLSLSGGAYPKGKENLYRVVTTQGEFVANEFHQVFSSFRKYLKVKELAVGDGIYLISQDPCLTSLESCPLEYQLNDPHYMRKAVNYLGDYAEQARQYGQQFLSGQGSALSFVPSLNGVQQLCLSYGHGDDLPPTQQRNHPVESCDHIYKTHLKSPAAPHDYVSKDSSLTSHFEHTSLSSQLFQQYHERYDSHHISLQSNPNQKDILPCDSPLSNPAIIIAIERLDKQEVYYDMQVLNTNNYIDETGFIHHNSGKSHLMGLTACTYATHSSSALIGVYEPDHNMIRRVAIPRIQFWLTQMGYSYSLNKQEGMLYTSSSGIGDFMFKSLSDPESLVAYETYATFLDELDTLTTIHAEEVFDKLLGRNRQNIEDVPQQYKVYNDDEGKWECVNKTFSYSTPEGFKFMYNMWHPENENAMLNPEFKIYHGKTEDNPVLSQTWINQLKAKYSKAKLRAYMNGEFVNLESGTVYYTFDRTQHKSFETIQHNDILLIGVDFNVGNCSAVVIVRRGMNYHAVAEITGALDTPHLIREILDRWPLNKKIVYPDATGVKRSSSNSEVSKTDIALLRLAGLTIRARSTNPLVRDRVACKNNLIEKGRYYVSEIGCPTYIKHIEQQAYVNGKPDKDSNNDHLPDAGGYVLAYEEDIKRPRTPLKYKFAQKRA